MASVTVEDVWDTLNVGDSDIPEAKVQKMIKRAAVTVGLEISTDYRLWQLYGRPKRSYNNFGDHLRYLFFEWGFGCWVKLPSGRPQRYAVFEHA